LFWQIFQLIVERKMPKRLYYSDKFWAFDWI